MLADYHGAADEAVFRWINTAATPWLDGVMVLLSDRRAGVGLLVAFALVSLLRRHRWPYRLSPAVFIGTLALTLAASDTLGARVAKPAFARLRPCFALAEVRTLYEQSNSPALPSLHAANAMALAVFLAFAATGRGRWFALIAGVIAVAVGYSRVYVGVHWPTDVLAGYVLGSLCATACWFAARRATR